MKKEDMQCKKFCEKTGECILDKIESLPVSMDEYEIVEDLKVAFPSRAKAFRLVKNDARERMGQEFWESGDFKEETFVWSDSVDCAKSVVLGNYAISTEIRLDDMHSSVSEIQA